MKKLILLIAFVVISQSFVFSQGCLPNGITFTTQEQIDNFQTNYPGCTEIEGDVTIQGEDITNLYGLTTLNSINSHLWIKHTALINLLGLDNLITVGSYIWIEHNSELTSLEGLESLIYFDSELLINSNEALTSLNGLENIQTVFNMTIRYNNALNSLAYLENLSTIINTLKIEHNSTLKYLNGLNNLSSVYDLSISDNDSLESFIGLTQLVSLGGYLIIYRNHHITNFYGLENLLSIGDRLYIFNNNSLINLNGLENLTTIQGDLWIGYNYNLSNIYSINNIAANSIENLEITGNPNLSECDIQNICEYLVSPNGIVDIHDNAPGCNSELEIEEACLTGVKENITRDEITLFPNPATHYITININGGLSIEEAIIYNHLGQKALVAVPVNNMLDVSTLKPGIYFLEVITSESRAGTKLVIE
jgi:hypothetical protein